MIQQSVYPRGCFADLRMFRQGLREGGGEIEIGIGIEIENLPNDAIFGKYGERLSNLQPETRYQKSRSFASDFDSDPDFDFDFDNPQLSTFNPQPSTKNSFRLRMKSALGPTQK